MTTPTPPDRPSRMGEVQASARDVEHRSTSPDGSRASASCGVEKPSNFAVRAESKTLAPMTCLYCGRNDGGCALCLRERLAEARREVVDLTKKLNHLGDRMPRWLAAETEVARLEAIIDNETVPVGQFDETVKRLEAEVERLLAQANEISSGRVVAEGAQIKAERQRDGLAAALREIARPKRGGVELNDPDEDWIEYWRRATERERVTAREALEKWGANEGTHKHKFGADHHCESPACSVMGDEGGAP